MAHRHCYAATVGLLVLAAACSKDSTATVGVSNPPADPAVALTVEVDHLASLLDQPIGPITVKARRSSGAIAVEFSGDVTIALDSASDQQLVGTRTVKAVAGVATFGDLKVTNEGTIRLRAATVGIPGALSELVSVMPRLSSRIAFSVCDRWGGSVFDDVCIRGAIVVRESDGTERQVASADAIPGDPAWSPDGRRIAYSGYDHCPVDSAVECHAEIYVINADGSAPTRLTKLESVGDSYAPSWTPDGTRLAFTTWSAATRTSRVYAVGTTGADAPAPLASLEGIAPAWSPDGRRLAFAADDHGRYAIFVANADGSAPVRLTNPSGVEGDAANDFQPTWSPDGSRLAFTRNRLRPGGSGYCQVHVVTLDASAPVQLTHDSFCAHAPSWSPDGTLIAYNGQERPGLQGLRVMRADGSHDVMVRRTSAWPSRATWAPR